MEQYKNFLTLEQFSNRQERDLQINSIKEIIAILCNIHKMRPVVSLHVSSGDNSDYFFTKILHVSNEFLWLDYGMSNNNELPKDRAIAANKYNSAFFVGLQDTIKVQFSINKFDIIDFEGTPAFCIPIPQTMLRIQRREDFRVHTPLLEHPTCTLGNGLATDSSKTPSIPMDTHSMEAHIVDISRGGIALIMKEENKHALLAQEQSIVDCQLNLPEGVVMVNLIVKNIVSIHHFHAQPSIRYGCQFINTSPHSTAQIMRYINTLQQALLYKAKEPI